MARDEHERRSLRSLLAELKATREALEGADPLGTERRKLKAEIGRLRDRLDTATLAAKVASEEYTKLEARIEAALALHQEFGIYDECGHDHTEEDVRTGKAIDVPEVGITCEDGLVQKVCRHCHLWNDEPYERTEDGECPCPTVEALTGGETRESATEAEVERLRTSRFP